MTRPVSRKTIWIDYTNWRGERRWRRIQPIGLFFESNEWHPEPQWIMAAHDFDRGESREFALSGIHETRNKEPNI